jgi:chromosome segregation ATPase
MLTVELKATLAAQEEPITTMTARLDEERRENNTALIKLQGRENEIRAMKSRLENERVEKESLLKKIEMANEDCLNMKLQLENMVKTKEEMDRKAKELIEKEGVSLGTIVVDQKEQ